MPEANRAIVLNCKHSELGLGKRFRLAKQLSGTYDQSIVLSRSIKSALIPYLAKIPIRTGERGESRYILINDLKSFSKRIEEKQRIDMFRCTQKKRNSMKNTFQL